MRVSFARIAAAAAFLAAVFVMTAPANAESVMASCAREWKQAQAAGATGGATWPQFLAQCKTQHSAAAAPAPAPAPPPPAPASQPQTGSLFPWLKPTQTAPAPTAAGQFSTEAAARYRCPSDQVVWVNNESKIYHYQGTRYYGRTKKGAYMCEADAKASGARASRGHSFGQKPQG